MDSSTDQFERHRHTALKLVDPIELLGPRDLVCRTRQEKLPVSTEMFSFREECLAAPQCLLRLLSLTDVPEKARKCFVTVSGHLAKETSTGNTSPFLRSAVSRALPIHMPLTG